MIFPNDIEAFRKMTGKEQWEFVSIYTLRTLSMLNWLIGCIEGITSSMEAHDAAQKLDSQTRKT